LLRDAEVTCESKEFVVRAMGYNNLLGFPYLYGYSQATLERLIAQWGFRFAGALNSELIRFPLPDDPRWVQEEEKIVSRELRLLESFELADGSGTLVGPWIEAWFRAV
jgi:hypothetical protein